MTLVVAIGGVRSGKSAWAEHQADELAGGSTVTVLATADPADTSMRERIDRHQARRDDNWAVVDLHGRADLAGALPERGVALLDGLGGWVASFLSAAGAFADDRAAAKSATTLAMGRAHDALQALIDAASEPGRDLVVVTEETGLGVVPLGAGTAAWVDLVGELNQRLVRCADLAVVVVAGRALPLGDSVRPLSPTRSGPPLSVVPQELRTATTKGVADDGERRAHPRLVGATPASRARRAEATAASDAAPLPGLAPATTAPRPRQNDRPAAAGAPANLAALRLHGDRLVRPGDADHAVNVVAQGPPSWLTDALAGVLLEGRLSRYPDVTEAERALAGLYGRTPAEVVATNGAAQALWLLPAALRPQLAACIHPLFTEAEAALHAHGVPVVRIHRDPAADFAIDASVIPEAADLVLLGNPAAASGTLTSADTVRSLLRPGRTVVVDEAFMDLVPGEAEALTAQTHEGLIVVRSFTKSLSIPGVRCGAALASPAVAEQLRAVRPPWSVNAFAIAAMVALAGHPDELTSRAEQAAAERADLVTKLADVAGLRAWPSSTNHVLVRVADGAGVAASLRAARIAVRPCGSFPGLTDDHLRITARSPAANAALSEALAAAITSGHGSIA